MSHGEGGFVEGPAEQNGRRGGRGAGRAHGWEESLEGGRQLVDFQISTEM